MADRVEDVEEVGPFRELPLRQGVREVNHHLGVVLHHRVDVLDAQLVVSWDNYLLYLLLLQQFLGPSKDCLQKVSIEHLARRQLVMH